MSVMLVATVGTGIVANHVLLAVPIHAMAWRWLLVVVVSYLAFFACVRVWLAYVGARPLYDPDSTNGGSWIDPGPGSAPGDWHGGGGSFGGGGASGSFDLAPADPLESLPNAAASSTSDSWAPDAGDALSAADNEGCALVVLGLMVIALLAGLAGSAIYIITMAPQMLGDAAFSALLAGGLIRSMRKMDEYDWKGSVLKSTWKPAAGIAAFAWVTGLVAGHVAPGARTLGELLMLYR